jgi:hypothetical protein
MPKSGKLKVALEFDLHDGSDTFGNFCKALIEGGFQDAVKQMGNELLKEAKRRNLPIADEFVMPVEIKKL